MGTDEGIHFVSECMQVFDDVLKVILRWEHLGSRHVQNGAHLIGHVPHVAPEAYLHIVFAPLDDAEIDTVECNIGRELPASLRAFFKRTNGLDLFSGALSLNGHRVSVERTGDAVWQPFNIVTPNVPQRPRNIPDDIVFFGFYDWDGSRLATSARSPVVWRFAPGTATRLNEWASVEEMLQSEVQRLATLFDEQGRQIDESVPTTP